MSSVLIASIRAHTSNRKCIHRGNTSVARVNSAADTSGYWKEFTDPLPTAAIPAIPSRKVMGTARAVAPYRLRFSDVRLSTV